MKSKSVPFLVKGCIPCAQCAAYHFLAHRCTNTIYLCHLDLEIIDDRHRHPNINIRDIYVAYNDVANVKDGNHDNDDDL